MSFLEKLREARAELEAHHKDPWHSKVAAAVRDKDAISTNSLIDLLRAPANTGSARRIAAIMRDLQFVAIKSRRLAPGGFRDTIARGWSRPCRQVRGSAGEAQTRGLSTYQGERIEQ